VSQNEQENKNNIKSSADKKSIEKEQKKFKQLSADFYDKPVPASLELKIKCLMWQFSYLQDQIKFAESKMNILLILHMVIIGAFSFKGDKLLKMIIGAFKLEGVLHFIGAVLFFIAGLCILQFFSYFLSAIKPRTLPEAFKDSKKEYNSVIFWGDVYEAMCSDLNCTDHVTWKDDIIRQIIVLSLICRIKFNLIHSAYYLFPWTAGFSAIVYIFMNII